MATVQVAVGALVRSTGTFKDINGAPIDPTIVTFSYRDPSTGTVTTLRYGVDSSVVKDGVGIYHVDVSTTSQGDWWVRWASTGTGQAASESVYQAKPSRVV